MIILYTTVFDKTMLRTDQTDALMVEYGWVVFVIG